MANGVGRAWLAKYGVASLIGLLAFWAWGGWAVLAPSHISWVLSGMDIPSQYLGWEYFRQTPWSQWPLGSNPGFGSDAPGTIVLADTIPIVAMLLKPFSSVLPLDFQYFGLWAMLCFVLQAWFGYLLMRRFTGDAVLCALGSAFFVLSSVFLVRVYMHPALAGQWVLLAAIYLGLAWRFPARRWALLLVFTVLVHAYLFAMVGSLWLAASLSHLWRNRGSRMPILAYMLVSLGAVALVMWAAGYFVPAAVTPMANRSHTNLLMPVWAGFCGGGEWSWVMPCSRLDLLSLMTISDGFGYFGVGYLFLIALAVLWLFWRRGIHPGPDWRVAAPVVMASLLLLLYAVGNKLYFENHVLFEFRLPRWLDRLSSVFRGAARMEWPIWYLLLLATLVTVVSKLQPGAARALLALALLLQCADLSRAAINLRNQVTRDSLQQNKLASPLWSVLASTHPHAVFLQPASLSPDAVIWMREYREVALDAAAHGSTINVASLARIDEARIKHARGQRESLLSQGKAEPGAFYVVADRDLWARVLCAPDHGQWRGEIDGQPVLVPDPASTPGLPAASTCQDAERAIAGDHA